MLAFTTINNFFLQLVVCLFYSLCLSFCGLLFFQRDNLQGYLKKHVTALQTHEIKGSQSITKKRSHMKWHFRYKAFYKVHQFLQ